MSDDRMQEVLDFTRWPDQAATECVIAEIMKPRV
jgi:hypothetical protein